MPLKHDTFTEIYKPDVLSCLADLSNDEVFTPPEVANQMLGMLPQELFRSPDTKFLDPACKSGVFLREIAKRLIAGIADKIPNLQERCIMGPLSRPRSKILRVAVSRIILSSEASKVKLVGNLVA